MERKSPRIRKLKMDRIQVERPANNNHRQSDRKNSLPKISPRGDNRQVTAGGDFGKMPRGYRARKNVQSNPDIIIGPPSPEETKLEIEKIKRTLVQKQSNLKNPIKPRSYDRVEDPKSESGKNSDSKNAKIDTWYASKKSDLQSDSKSGPKPVQQPVRKSNSKSGPKSIQQPVEKSSSKTGPKPVQEPVQNSNSRKNRRKMQQTNQKNDMSSKLEVSVPKSDEKSKTAARSPPQKQPKTTNRRLSKNDPKMTKSKTTSDKKISKKVEISSNSTSKQTKIDITKIDQSLSRNKRTNKTSRREVFDETKNPEQTIRTLMYEERFLTFQNYAFKKTFS